MSATIETNPPLEIKEPDDAMGTPDEDAGSEAVDLLLACCQPSLPSAARVALALHLVARMSVAEVALAFDVSEPTMAVRLDQAQRRLDGLPSDHRDDEALPHLQCARDVIHLAFNEGQRAAARGDHPMEADAAVAAIGLARLALQRFPDDAELRSLLAFMLFVHARRDAREDEDGSLRPFDQQDRSRWHEDEMAEARFHLHHSRRNTPSGSEGPFQLRAIIQSLQTDAAAAAEVPWPLILATYTRLTQVDRSDVVALHRASALAQVEGPAAALELVESLGNDSHLAHAVRADLLRRLARDDEADRAWQEAVARSRGGGHRPGEPGTATPTTES